jgi:hypothetical protein
MGRLPIIIARRRLADPHRFKKFKPGPEYLNRPQEAKVLLLSPRCPEWSTVDCELPLLAVYQGLSGAWLWLLVMLTCAAAPPRAFARRE